ncbi:variant leucine-rich repeat-containing protein [Brachybacterium sp. DNPG3]
MSTARSAAEEAQDPGTSPERLLELTNRHPELQGLIVANPSCPAVARDWILATNPGAKRLYEQGAAPGEIAEAVDAAHAERERTGQQPAVLPSAGSPADRTSLGASAGASVATADPFDEDDAAGNSLEETATYTPVFDETGPSAPVSEETAPFTPVFDETGPSTAVPDPAPAPRVVSPISASAEDVRLAGYAPVPTFDAPDRSPSEADQASAWGPFPTAASAETAAPSAPAPSAPAPSASAPSAPAPSAGGSSSDAPAGSGVRLASGGVVPLGPAGSSAASGSPQSPQGSAPSPMGSVGSADATRPLESYPVPSPAPAAPPASPAWAPAPAQAAPGQPTYGQPAPGQPAYGQASPGQPGGGYGYGPAGSAAAGAPAAPGTGYPAAAPSGAGYAAAPAGAAVFGTPPPAGGAPAGGAPGAAPADSGEGKDRRRTWIACAGCLLLVLILVIVGVFGVRAWLGGDDDGYSRSSESTTAQSSEEAPSEDASEEATTEPSEEEDVSPAPDGSLDLTSVQSPTGNIRCSLAEGSVGCSVSERDFSAGDQEDCSETAFSIAISSGEAALACGTVYGSESATTLEYGSSTTIGEVACTSRSDGMTCWNIKTGKGFMVNRDEYRTF